MSVFTVNYLLPAILGYTLYLGISSRWSLTRPSALAGRPSWALGLWTGLVVSAVLMTALHFAYGTSIEEARHLLPTFGLALAALLCAGAAACLLYRSKIAHVIAKATDEPSSSSEGAEIQLFELPLNTDDINTNDFDGFGAEITALHDGQPVLPEQAKSLETGANLEQAKPLAEHEFLEEIVTTGQIEALEQSDEFANETVEVTEGNIAPNPGTDHESTIAQLESERQQREEVERHLLITRKALHRLEAQPRVEAAHQETIAELESRLAEHTHQVSAAESRAERESITRIASENTINELREDIASASTDLRRSVEARAKALSTANKSVALARSANRARARAESKIQNLEATLDNRQQTISSLIKSLEKEKRRSQEEVSQRARELILHERQLRSRRNLEEVSRSVEGNLTSRLVKKVARSRTVTNNS